MAFAGSMLFGLTAVVLKLGTKGQNVYYSLFMRASSAVPILLIINIYRGGVNFYDPFLENKILVLIVLSSIGLLLGDVLLMHILKTKPVGVITPIIATNPFFTTILLLLAGEGGVTAKIILLTLSIVLGVFLVTYNKSNNTEFNDKIIDTEAMMYGLGISFTWGIMLFLDIQILQEEDIDGFTFSGIKVMIVGIVSILLVMITALRNNEFEMKFVNKKSMKFMLLAGILGWVLGAILVYSAFDKGPAPIINPIVGLNPLFSTVFSIILMLEGINKTKSLGIALCVLSSILLIV
jgi:drug/metabolite transporter (DMT)-like permease